MSVGGRPAKYRYGMSADELLSVADRAYPHHLVQIAVKFGVIRRFPCVVCNSSESIAHHYDYRSPLDVIWLCQQHHLDEHVRLGVGVGKDNYDYGYIGISPDLTQILVSRHQDEGLQ